MAERLREMLARREEDAADSASLPSGETPSAEPTWKLIADFELAAKELAANPASAKRIVFYTDTRNALYDAIERGRRAPSGAADGREPTPE